MKNFLRNKILILSSVVLILLCSLLLARSQYYVWLSVWFFVSCVYLRYWKNDDGFLLYLIPRIIYVFLPVFLSDDVYRFLWDGTLLLSGINPYKWLPSELDVVALNLTEVYPKLNSPDYYSVYPPVNQLFFAVAAFFSKTIYGFTIALKLQLLVCELVLFQLLQRVLSQFSDPKWAMLYWANPLVLVEIMGNAHFEGVMAMFVLAAVYAFIQKKHFLSGVLMAFSVHTKLLSALWAYSQLQDSVVRRKASWLVGFIVTTFFIASSIGSVENAIHFLESIQLYFQRFEFNASVYFVLREIGYWVTGYNAIQVIGSITGLSVFVYANYLLFVKKATVLRYSESILFAYLLLATTVHPWYVISLVVLACFTRNVVTIAWSITVFFSYHFYQNGGHQVLWLILEYGSLAIVWWKKEPISLWLWGDVQLSPNEESHCLDACKSR